MRALLLFVLSGLFICYAGLCGAATISGTITVGTGTSATPLSGALIYLSYGSYPGITTTTSGTGSYSFAIPSGWTTGTKMTLAISHLATPCGSQGYRDFPYTGASLVQSFSVCPDLYNLQGQVTKGTTGNPAVNAKVYLIASSVDTTVTPPATTLMAIDSTTTNTSGNYQFKTAWSIHLTNVKAALQSSDADYANYLPTYFGSSLTWGAANQVGFQEWMWPSSTDFALIAGSNPGGPAFIGGDVALGANKSSAIGDPLGNRVILLTTDADVPVAYAYSDAAGKFSIPNLPYGSYKLFGDALGKGNPELSITLSQSRPSVANVKFVENRSFFVGTVESLGVPNSVAAFVALYPNPAHDVLNLYGVPGEVNVTLRNVMGVVVRQVTEPKGEMLSINMEDLPAGLYHAQIQSKNGFSWQTVVKQ